MLPIAVYNGRCTFEIYHCNAGITFKKMKFQNVRIVSLDDVILCILYMFYSYSMFFILFILEEKLRGHHFIFKLQVNNLHINITWSAPLMPRGPLSAFRLQIRELPNEKSHVIHVSTSILDFI